MAQIFAGIDIGGTTIKIGLFPAEGEALAAWEIKTRKFEGYNIIFSDIAESIFRKMDELHLDRNDLKSAGMGLPGPIREDGYLSSCVNLGMDGCYPAEEFSKILGVPVAAGNDANVAALGEANYGACKGYQDAVMVTLGTGVGGGIISRGKMIAGNRGLGGEIGHFVVNPDETDACNCGNKGCLEQYASATGIVRIAGKKMKEFSESSLHSFENLSCKDVCDEAKKGDEAACATLEVFGRYLGMALAHIILTNDPDVIAIGGGVSKAGPILLTYVNRYVDAFTHITKNRAEIVFATLGNNAGIYGAAALAKTLVPSEV